MTNDNKEQPLWQKLHLLFIYVSWLLIPGSLGYHTTNKDISAAKCQLAVDEMTALGLSVCIPKQLPISYSAWLTDSKSSSPGAECKHHASQSEFWPPGATHPKQNAHSSRLKASRENHSNLDEYGFPLSLCAPRNQGEVNSMKTCCTIEMKRNLLIRAQREVQEGLAVFLTRWSADVSKLRIAFREQFFNTFEIFRHELDKALCSDVNTTHMAVNCSQFSALLFHKFRTMGEQLMLGKGDMFMELSIPIDNLIMQLLIDSSCQAESQSDSNTLEEFNEEIRCHKYCQARLNLILDSSIGRAESTALQDMAYANPHPESHLHSSTKHPWLQRRVHEFPELNSMMEKWRQTTFNHHKTLYDPDLLFTVRMNRLLMQSLELAETLIKGLTEFNPAQGSCMRKIMRMHRCSLCAGEPLIRPCPELCYTVMSNCLKPLSELQSSWRRFTEAIKLVAQTLLAKPQLSLIVQFRQLPRRLINYFRHFLTTHKEWLQPQCPGTSRLLELFSLGGSLDEKSTPTLHDAERPIQLNTHRELLDQLERKTHLWVEIWTRAGSAVCNESPHLAPTSTSLDNCWNGTTIGRFSITACDFCGQMEESVGNRKMTTSSSDFSTHNNQQRNSQTQLPNYKSSISDRHESFREKLPYTVGNPSDPIYPKMQPETEVTTHRANELLVKASRNLVWSTNALVGEVRAYNTMQRTNDVSTNSNEHTKQNSSPSSKTESWVQIPTNQVHNNFAPTLHSGSDSPPNEVEELNNSLRLLAYGSMLGWNAHSFDRRRSSDRSKTHDQRSPGEIGKKGEKFLSRHKTSSNKMKHDQTLNVPNVPHESVESGSGAQPSWTAYAWPPLPQSTDLGASTESVNMRQNIPDGTSAQEFAGSGFIGSHNGLPSFMDYAEYPSLGPLHNLKNPGDPPKQVEVLGEGAPVDDEDFVEYSNGSHSGDTHDRPRPIPDIVKPIEHSTQLDKAESYKIHVKSGNQDIIEQKKNESASRMQWSSRYFSFQLCSTSVILLWLSSCFV